MDNSTGISVGSYSDNFGAIIFWFTVTNFKILVLFFVLCFILDSKRTQLILSD